eukprot:COSAG05_NODE_117_length_17936_cov_137.220945_7_plen_344_part_00
MLRIWLAALVCSRYIVTLCICGVLVLGLCICAGAYDSEGDRVNSGGPFCRLAPVLNMSSALASDAYGPASSVVPGDLTAEAFSGDLQELGWRGRYKFDDPEVVALREALTQNAGIPGLEVVDPSTPGFAHRAAFLLNRDGYCVVKDVLSQERLAKIRRGAEICIREMVGRDPERSGNRGSHRYSFGSAPAHFGLQDYWSVLKDPPAVLEVMEAIFGTKDFVCTEGGGDFNTPGSVEYQHLHSDGGGKSGLYPDVKLEYRNDGTRQKVSLDAEEQREFRYQIVNARDLPVREHQVTANYPMEICLDSDVGHTPFNGATRQIPATQSLDVRNGNPIPTEDEEPLW